MLTLWCTE